MNHMCNFGIKDLLIINNINMISAELMNCALMLEDAGMEINKLVKQYLSDMDSIDKFKY